MHTHPNGNQQSLKQQRRNLLESSVARKRAFIPLFRLLNQKIKTWNASWLLFWAYITIYAYAKKLSKPLFSSVFYYCTWNFIKFDCKKLSLSYWLKLSCCFSTNAWNFVESWFCEMQINTILQVFTLKKEIQKCVSV